MLRDDVLYVLYYILCIHILLKEFLPILCLSFFIFHNAWYNTHNPLTSSFLLISSSCRFLIIYTLKKDVLHFHSSFYVKKDFFYFTAQRTLYITRLFASVLLHKSLYRSNWESSSVNFCINWRGWNNLIFLRCWKFVEFCKNDMNIKCGRSTQMLHCAYNANIYWSCNNINVENTFVCYSQPEARLLVDKLDPLKPYPRGTRETAAIRNCQYKYNETIVNHIGLVNKSEVSIINSPRAASDVAAARTRSSGDKGYWSPISGCVNGKWCCLVSRRRTYIIKP